MAFLFRHSERLNKVKTDIKSMSFDEISSEFKSDGLPSFRANQVFDWLTKGIESFDQMTNLSKDLRTSLDNKYEIITVKIKRKLYSKLDETVKYLFELSDGEYIESVIMKYHHGYTQCISTQAGCRMGCSFCATGMGGYVRNLTPSEMLSQIMVAQNDLGIRVSNLVLMGMGEPLDNYDNTVKFLKLVMHEKGLNIGARHISLSTCGLVDKIYELMKLDMQITLSISLHAPNDRIRNKLMPVNKKWNTDKLLAACREYTNYTGRRISFEYIIIDGVNNTVECLNELSTKLKGMLCHINLIPANPVKGTDNHGTRKAAEAFRDELIKRGINATVRRTLGSDIEASCGQLKASEN